VEPHTMAVNTGTYNGTVTLLWKVTDRWGLSRTLPARTLIADNKPPTLISSGPGNNAKVKGTATITVKASDVSGIARLQLIVNGGVVATDTTSPYVLSVNTAKVAKTMKVQIRAYDKLGNVITTSARTWYRA
jgi:hypothetical protein